MKNKLFVILLLAIIIFINIVYLKTNEAMGSVAYGAGRAMLFFVVISFIYCFINASIIVRAPTIIHIVAWLGIVSFFSTILNLKNFDLISILTTPLQVLYWVAAFLVAYTIILKQPQLLMVAINGFYISFFIVAYYYFTITLFFNYFGTNRFYSLDQSYYLLFFLPFILKLKKNSLKLIGISIVLSAMLISMKRTGTIALFGALGVYFILAIFHKDKQTYKRFYNSLFVVISLIILNFVFNYVSDKTGGFLLSRFETLQIDEGSGRLDIWKGTFDAQMNADFTSWILGHGYNTVKESIAGNSAHNDFQEVLYDYGIFGFVLYLFIYFQLLSYCKKMYKFSSLHLESFTASCVLFLILSCFSHLIIYPSYFICLAFFWGVSIAGFENEQNKRLCAT